MIGNPFLKKIKENSLWWLLIAAVVVLLGAVVIGQTSLDLSGQRRLLAEEEPVITVEIIGAEEVGGFVFVDVEFFDKDGKLMKISVVEIPADKYSKKAVENLIFEAIPGFSLKGKWKIPLPSPSGGSTTPSPSPNQTPSPTPFIPDTDDILKIDLDRPVSNTLPGISNWRLARDPNSHEASHGISGMARQTFPDRKGTGIHIGFNEDGDAEVIWIYEPETTIRDMRNSVPRFAQRPWGATHRYKTYFFEQNQSWNELTYIFEEWGAYIIGARNAVEKAEAGRWRDGKQGMVDGPANFIVFGTAAADYLKKNEPKYFARDDFQFILKYQLEQSADLIKRGLQFDSFNQFSAQAIIDGFLKDPSAADIRRMLIGLYGQKWMDDIFDFEYLETTPTPTPPTPSPR